VQAHQVHLGDLAERPLQLQQELASVASRVDTAQLGGMQKGLESWHFPPPKAHSLPKLPILDRHLAKNQLCGPNIKNKDIAVRI
jgi:hypothetical protein